VRSLAAFMFLPVLLIMWAPSADFPELPVQAPPSESATLNASALFDGAIARQDDAALPGASFRTRGATFPDGSELRLMHFSDTRGAETYLATQFSREQPLINNSTAHGKPHRAEAFFAA